MKGEEEKEVAVIKLETKLADCFEPRLEPVTVLPCPFENPNIVGSTLVRVQLRNTLSTPTSSGVPLSFHGACLQSSKESPTTNSSVRNNKPNPGDKALATTPTKTDRPVFFAGYRVIVKRSVAKGSRLTNHAWTPMDAHFGPR